MPEIPEQRPVQDWYDDRSVAEFLCMSPYTVREYCRRGIIHAQVRPSGPGNTEKWMISRDELMRFKRGRD
ncbi:MAG: helix-turn-helix domain-containing protein [Planctomycetota bacterium]|nr:helix-turn-helix domain-containing protein [Planctomycetota bacterium]